MNVLLVASKMDNGGAETHILELARGLLARGHQVTLASSGGRVADALCLLGVAQIRLPLDRKTPVALSRSVLGLCRLLKKRRFDIVHAHTRIGALAAHIACERQGVCLVTTIHAHLRASSFLHRLSRWGRATIAVSRDLYRYMLIYCPDVSHDRVTVIPNGIDTDCFCPSEERPRVGGRVRIAFLSRLDRDCSSVAYSLCRIGAALDRATGGRAEIIIGGGGSELVSVEREARRANEALGRELIRVVGRVEDTASFLREADIFVGVSRAALEAMSCAVPVVLAGDEGFLGALDEKNIEQAESTNFCCRGCKRVGDSTLLSSLLSLLRMSDGERRQRGRYLREYAVRKHSSHEMVRLTESVYKKALAEHRTEGSRGNERGSSGALLCGYYGFGNLGDELMLRGAIRRATEGRSRRSVCVLTKNGKRDGRRYGVTCERRFDLYRVCRRIKDVDTVVLGGGTLLQNGSSRRSLWYYLFIMRTAQRAGKRVELWGNGIDDIKGRADRARVARALSGCAYVGLRDGASVRNLHYLIKESDLVMPRHAREKDLAEYLGAELTPQECACAETLFRESVGGNVGRTAVIALKGGESAERADSLRRWVTRLAGEGIFPLFVVMYPAEDMRASKKMCDEVGGALIYPASEKDMLWLMRRSELVCGMRYHALMLAALAETPFVGFGGEQKIRELCVSRGGVYYEELEDAPPSRRSKGNYHA